MVATSPLLVIGAALSRTGTLSTKLALERLGHKVWHGTFLPQDPWPRLFQDLALAEKHQNDTAQKHAMDQIVQQLSNDGFTVTLDLPMAVIYSDLMERYPNAKVLLTVRYSAQDWARSFVSNVCKLFPLMMRRPFLWIPRVRELKEMRGWLFQQRLGVKDSNINPRGISKSDAIDEAEIGSTMSVLTALDMYKCYVAQVKATVPSTRLLEYNVEQGWQPLCDFIGFRDTADNEQQVCPSEKGEPFPNVNQSGTGVLKQWSFAVYFVTYTWHIVSVTGAGLAVFFVVRVCRYLSRCCRRLASPRFRHHQD